MPPYNDLAAETKPPRGKAKKYEVEKKVAIRRVKRDHKKLTAREKILAGLGLGTTLIGGAAGFSAQPRQKTQLVRTQSGQDSITKNIVGLELNRIFGVPLAHADEGDGSDSGNDQPMTTDEYYAHEAALAQAQANASAMLSHTAAPTISAQDVGAPAEPGPAQVQSQAAEQTPPANTGTAFSTGEYRDAHPELYTANSTSAADVITPPPLVPRGSLVTPPPQVSEVVTPPSVTFGDTQGTAKSVNGVLNLPVGDSWQINLTGSSAAAGTPVYAQRQTTDPATGQTVLSAPIQIGSINEKGEMHLTLDRGLTQDESGQWTVNLTVGGTVDQTGHLAGGQSIAQPLNFTVGDGTPASAPKTATGITLGSGSYVDGQLSVGNFNSNDANKGITGTITDKDGHTTATISVVPDGQGNYHIYDSSGKQVGVDAGALYIGAQDQETIIKNFLQFADTTGPSRGAGGAFARRDNTIAPPSNPNAGQRDPSRVSPGAGSTDGTATKITAKTSDVTPVVTPEQTPAATPGSSEKTAAPINMQTLIAYAAESSFDQLSPQQQSAFLNYFANGQHADQIPPIFTATSAFAYALSFGNAQPDDTKKVGDQTFVLLANGHQWVNVTTVNSTSSDNIQTLIAYAAGTPFDQLSPEQQTLFTNYFANGQHADQIPPIFTNSGAFAYALGFGGAQPGDTKQVGDQTFILLANGQQWVNVTTLPVSANQTPPAAIPAGDYSAVLSRGATAIPSPQRTDRINVAVHTADGGLAVPDQTKGSIVTPLAVLQRDAATKTWDQLTDQEKSDFTSYFSNGQHQSDIPSSGISAGSAFASALSWGGASVGDVKNTRSVIYQLNSDNQWVGIADVNNLLNHAASISYNDLSNTDKIAFSAYFKDGAHADQIPVQGFHSASAFASALGLGEGISGTIPKMMPDGQYYPSRQGADGKTYVLINGQWMSDTSGVGFARQQAEQGSLISVSPAVQSVAAEADSFSSYSAKGNVLSNIPGTPVQSQSGGYSSVSDVPNVFSGPVISQGIDRGEDSIPAGVIQEGYITADNDNSRTGHVLLNSQAQGSRDLGNITVTSDGKIYDENGNEITESTPGFSRGDLIAIRNVIALAPVASK